MKILFTADLHIKLGQSGVPKEWAKNRYQLLTEKLIDIIAEYDVEMMIFGGDVFDRAPTVEEVAVFISMLAQLPQIPKLIFSGNHEAEKKTTTFLSHMKELVQPYSAHIVDSHWVDEGYEVLPYNCLKTFESKPFTAQQPILFTHVRGAIPPHVTPEVPLELFDSWDAVFAGDLHSRENSQRNIYYPGSPVTTSFHRNLVKTYCIVVNIDSKSFDWVHLDVPQLIRKTVNTVDAMVKTDYHHTVYELEGDAQEISRLGRVDNPLLDKKIIIKEEKPSAIKSVKIEDQLYEYFVNILGLSKEKAQALVTKCHDYVNFSTVE